MQTYPCIPLYIPPLFSVSSVYRAIVFCPKTKIVGTAFSWRGGSNVYQQSIFEQKILHIACASFRNEKSVIQVSFNCFNWFFFFYFSFSSLLPTEIRHIELW